MTAAHDQTVTLHIVEHYPAHEPRENDPHYAAFHRARERMKRAGLLRCVIAGCTFPGPIELHHSHVEFALQNGVDIGKLDEAYGLHLDEASFADWINSPANLEALCPQHHRGALGVHCLPGPVWEPLRVWRSGPGTTGRDRVDPAG